MNLLKASPASMPDDLTIGIDISAMLQDGIGFTALDAALRAYLAEFGAGGAKLFCF